MRKSKLAEVDDLIRLQVQHHDDGDDDDCDGNCDDDSLVTKRLKLEFLSQRWQSHSEQGVKEFIVRCKEGEDGDDENIAEIVNFFEIRKVLV